MFSGDAGTELIDILLGEGSGFGNGGVVDMADKDAPAELRRRAETLRSCARRARTAAHAMGTYLDSDVAQATGSGSDLIWIGPYATDTTSTLQQRQSTLQRMAQDLVTDAGRWETEAGYLEDRANGKQGGS